MDPGSFKQSDVRLSDIQKGRRTARRDSGEIVVKDLHLVMSTAFQVVFGPSFRTTK